jgi:hypothetical protein
MFLKHNQSCQLKNPKIKPEKFYKKKPENPEISGKNRKINDVSRLKNFNHAFLF